LGAYRVTKHPPAHGWDGDAALVFCSGCWSGLCGRGAHTRSGHNGCGAGEGDKRWTDAGPWALGTVGVGTVQLPAGEGWLHSNHRGMHDG
jgi:hypothetical protein